MTREELEKIRDPFEHCRKIGAELREGGHINTTDDQVLEAFTSILENDFNSENYIVKRLLGDEVNNG